MIASLVSLAGRQVGLVNGKEILEVSTVQADVALVGVTFTVWTLGCFAGFSSVVRTSMTTSDLPLPLVTTMCTT